MKQNNGRLNFTLPGAGILVGLVMCIACSPAVEGSDGARSTDMQPATETTVKGKLPPIDLMVPDEIQTATFALG
jgi:hypothetical protein